ncbi:hypothetical protein [Pseudoalteromonas luteoviolacea]|uniref:Uncharacterized protein n=1 Tax=Pseudoalteromonas luteoviolacea NCIMB 1942 TaxID=1365253 RepID=A0A167H897_9GAMM|nr:hypothetical protein [Pseudoalteromonas luteoviolacea]KZN57745.1 hypothetical protein N482_04400 [Pseudoalteromonas luteoviolacea NCIMB 1942]KZW99884.1 hypothetical protein JL49_14750 [Pseudoalteromonas luteoviolacea]
MSWQTVLRARMGHSLPFFTQEIVLLVRPLDENIQMIEILNASTIFNLLLDKGVLIVPTAGPLDVVSKGMICQGEIAVQDDIEKFLQKKVNMSPYIQGAYVAGGAVTFSAINDIVLSDVTFKGGAPIVLKGDIKCSLSVIPALNDKGIPDPSPPTELTVKFVPTQPITVSK